MKTKIIIALVAVAALTLALVGAAVAQVAQNQTYPSTTRDGAAPNSGFWGWIGSCFEYRNSQSYYGESVAPQERSDGPGAPYQGGYGYGPCWAR